MHWIVQTLVFLGLLHGTISQRDPGGTAVSGLLSGRSRNSVLVGDMSSGSRLSVPPSNRDRGTGASSSIVDSSSPVITGRSLIPPADVVMEPNINDINPPYVMQDQTGQSGSRNTNTRPQGEIAPGSRNTGGFVDPRNLNDPFRGLISGGQGRVTVGSGQPNVQNRPQVSQSGTMTVSNTRTEMSAASRTSTRNRTPNMEVQLGSGTATFNMGTNGKVVHKFLPTNLFENINSVSRKPKNVDSVPVISAARRNPGPSVSVRNIFGDPNSLEGASVQLGGSDQTFVDTQRNSFSGLPVGGRDPVISDPLASLRNQVVPDSPNNSRQGRNSMITAPIIDNPTSSNAMNELNALIDKKHLDEALGMYPNGKNNPTNSMGNRIPGLTNRALGRCRFRPFIDAKSRLMDARYYLQMVNGEWQTAKCAPGSGYNKTTCMCSDNLSLKMPAGPCTAEVAINFNDGVVENITPNRVSIVAEGVDAANGHAYLNGSTQMDIEYFKGYELQDKFLVKFRFKSDSRIRDTPHPLFTNCDPENINIEPSVGVILNSFADSITFVVKTTNSTIPKIVTFKIKSDSWVDVMYMYDGKYLTGRVTGQFKPQEKRIAVQGKIEPNKNVDLVFGYCGRYGRFKGSIDDIQIYTCIPQPRPHQHPVP